MHNKAQSDVRTVTCKAEELMPMTDSCLMLSATVTFVSMNSDMLSNDGVACPALKLKVDGLYSQWICYWHTAVPVTYCLPATYTTYNVNKQVVLNAGSKRRAVPNT